MTLARGSLALNTRRHLAQILRGADVLPERSQASRALTAIACRLQLFVFELERTCLGIQEALGIEQLLASLSKHSQLLVAASGQCSRIQTGYALLTELVELLASLEASVLRLPGHLGNDSRAKPALDELQALLGAVSLYQSECEETRSHLEAALSELVSGGAVAARETSHLSTGLGAQPGAQASATTADAAAAVGSGSLTAAGSSSSGGGADPDAAVLLRVRQAVCALDLDVEMAEPGQDLEAELLQLRDHMRRELERQAEQEERAAAQRAGQRPPPPAALLQQLQLSQQGPSEAGPRPQPAAPARAGGRRLRDGPGGPEEHSQHQQQQQQQAGHQHALVGSRVARLYAVRAVTRRLAAQQLAGLKEEQQRRAREEQQRQGSADGGSGRDGGGSGSAPGVEQPAARRRRVQESGAAARGDPSLTSNAVAEGTAAGAAGGASIEAISSAAEVRVARTGSWNRPSSSDATTGRASSRHGGRGGSDGGSEDGSSRYLEWQLSADSGDGGPSGGGGGGGGPAASVAALRRLNRVAQLAGLWESGRPVAQSAEAEAEGDAAQATADGGMESDADTEEGAAGCRHVGHTEEPPCLPARPVGSLSAVRRASPPAQRPPLPSQQQQQQQQRAGSPPPWPPLPSLPLPPLPSLPPLPQQGADAGRLAAAAASSPFLLLALQGRAPQAPPPPVLGRLLCPCPEELPAPPAAAGGACTTEEGCGDDGVGLAQAAVPAAAVPGGVAAAAVNGQPAAAAAAPQHRGAPAPLPLPDASVHLRAVGLPGLPAPVLPHWHLAGPFGGAGLAGWPPGCGPSPLAPPAPLLELGPDVPAINLREITGWGACLGRGAFGCVYKAMYRNKPVAVKLLHGGGGLESRDLRCLRSEIRLLCRLRPHPAIITVLGAAAAPPDGVALVSELMDCDLYDYIHRRRQNCVPLGEVLLIARAIASGLSELHPAVVHRDLKPANVLLRLTGHAGHAVGGGVGPAGAAGAGAGPAAQQQRLVVKIADFGLARHKRSQYLSTRERDAGTLKYMAPECIASCRDVANGEGGGGGVTEKCDIYSFGVLLYELITGREPWEGCHPLYAVCQVQSGATLPLPDDPLRCPPPLRALVQRCWAAQHGARPSSAELVAELDELIAAQQQQQQQQGLLQEQQGGQQLQQHQQQQGAPAAVVAVASAAAAVEAAPAPACSQ